MNVAVFENEYEGLKNSFEALSILEFDGELKFKYYPKFESFGPISKISQSDFAIVDLELAKNSQYDGFQVISMIEKEKEKQKVLKPKILIMSGKKDLLEKLKNDSSFEHPILIKPIDYNQFTKELKLTED
ncbi:MAG: hypothetical protein JXQ96_17310 [Cyclobacteriaceae bacterium]